MNNMKNRLKKCSVRAHHGIPIWVGLGAAIVPG